MNERDAHKTNKIAMTFSVVEKKKKQREAPKKRSDSGGLERLGGAS